MRHQPFNVGKAMHLWQLAMSLEEMNTTVIRDAYPAPWTEDDITLSWMKAWRRQLRTTIRRPRSGLIQIRCEGYKYRGTQETRFGDIALLMSVAFEDGIEIEGVGYLEAKRRDRRKSSFSSLDPSQARRIVGNAPKACLLLYDYEAATGLRAPDGTSFEAWRYPYRWNQMLAFTHMVSLPLDMFVETGKADRSLYRFGVPLSVQFAYRYMFGLDLHHGKEHVESVSDFRTAQEGAANFVLKVEVAHGNVELPDGQSVSNDLYESIGE